MKKLPFALQLYTVRDHLEKDPAETLKKIKEIGYDYVEVAMFLIKSALEFKKLLDDSGLKSMSVMADFSEITQDVPATIELARIFDVKFIVVPIIDSSLTPDKSAWLKCAEALDASGAKLREAGIQLCYHNHAHEFQQYDGQYIFDILYENAEPNNLAAEIDTYWVQYGGLDPVNVINKYSGRCPLIHVKDMRDAQNRAFAEMGRGILPWSAILPAATKAGAKWFIVEQDTCPGDSLESAAISAKFMAAL